MIMTELTEIWEEAQHFLQSQRNRAKPRKPSTTANCTQTEPVSQAPYTNKYQSMGQNFFQSMECSFTSLYLTTAQKNTIME
jgi:hypothetical protein